MELLFTYYRLVHMHSFIAAEISRSIFQKVCSRRNAKNYGGGIYERIGYEFNLSGKGKLGRKAFAKLRLYKVVIGNYQNSICGETNAYSHPPDYIYTFVYLNVQPDHVQRSSCQINAAL